VDGLRAGPGAQAQPGPAPPGSRESRVAAPLHVNYEYCLQWAARVREGNPSARILDYGCGAGEVVQAGLERGLDIFGADEFYAGGNSREAAAESGLLGGRIREIQGERMDFADRSFDLVLSNQVFEHVEDLDRVVDEVWRVLKPGGLLLALFPSAKVIREGHIGIPLVHWLPRSSRLRYWYTLGMRSLGLGYFKAGKSRDRWTADALEWLDRYTYYRPERVIRQALSRRFTVAAAEGGYAAFRLAASPRTSALAPAARWPGADWLARVAIRRLAGMVLVATRREP
jgi:SAM-dependent methyltransferase